MKQGIQNWLLDIVQCVLFKILSFTDLVDVQLENSGKNCWVKCNNKQGKCDWCGKGGYCCKKGWHESNPTSHGCDGSFGGVSFHACVLKPKCDLDPSPTGGMYKQCVFDPISGFK